MVGCHLVGGRKRDSSKLAGALPLARSGTVVARSEVDHHIGYGHGKLDRERIVGRTRRMNRTVETDNSDITVRGEQVSYAPRERTVASSEYCRRHIDQRRSVQPESDSAFFSR